MIYIIYLLTVIGLSPGGSTHLHINNIHIYTQTIYIYIYIYPYIQPEDGFYEPKHVAINYLQ